MTKQQALVWLQKMCPPEFYGSLEYFNLEDLIHIIYNDGKVIEDRVIYVEDEK